jgi:hypothetical protein
MISMSIYSVFNSENNNQVHVNVFLPDGQDQSAVVSGISVDMNYIERIAAKNLIFGRKIIVKPVKTDIVIKFVIFIYCPETHI